MTELQKKVEFICTKAEYLELRTNGSITKNGVTHIYDPSIDYKVIGHYLDESEINALLSEKQNVKTTATITDNSTVAITDNTEYSGSNLTTVTFTYPQGDFECYMSLSFASSGTITVTFPTSQYIGNVPTFKNGKTYEISIKNGVIVAGEVTSGV